jgi:hypothetical protein
VHDAVSISVEFFINALHVSAILFFEIRYKHCSYEFRPNFRQDQRAEAKAEALEGNEV